MVSKAADRSRRQRHDNFCDEISWIYSIGCLSGVMLAVGSFVGIDKTFRDNVISKATFYNTFILDMREGWRFAGSWRVGLCLE